MWQQPPVPIEARPNGTSVVSLRLPTAEFHALLQAARQAGMTVSAHVRAALALRMTPQGPATAVTENSAYPVTTLTITIARAQG